MAQLDVLLQVPGVPPPVKDCILMGFGHRGAAAGGARSLSQRVCRRAKARNHYVEIRLWLDCKPAPPWLKLRLQLKNWGWRWADDNQVALIVDAQQVCTWAGPQNKHWRLRLCVCSGSASIEVRFKGQLPYNAIRSTVQIHPSWRTLQMCT